MMMFVLWRAEDQTIERPATLRPGRPTNGPGFGISRTESSISKFETATRKSHHTPVLLKASPPVRFLSQTFLLLQRWRRGKRGTRPKPKETHLSPPRFLPRRRWSHRIRRQRPPS